LQAILAGREFLTVGLMSGTSMDAVDAALVHLKADPDRPTPRLEGFVSVPYPETLRDALRDASSGAEGTTEEIARLHTSVAVAFAGAFYAVCRKADVSANSVWFIGSHGQTVAHVPAGSTVAEGGEVAGTLQLGPPGMIAALTGVTTVGDFRVADLAAGGQGAPLAPWADYILRRSATGTRVILNIGGISNVTVLPRGCGPGDVVAFDTGPGNLVVDALQRALYPGDDPFDRGGRHALAGAASTPLLEEMMKHPYLQRKPPRSAGHREFGAAFAWQFLARARALGLSPDDTMATAAAYTAETITDALKRFVDVAGGLDEVYLTGGGQHNKAIVGELSRRLDGMEVQSIDRLGIPGDAKEAVDFALLAREALFARSAVLPGVTGAASAQVLGTIAFGRSV